MMRITEVSQSESVARFRVEGRLTHAATAEILLVVDPFLTIGSAVLLDLAGVTFADAAAVQSLVALRDKGAVLVGASTFLSEMLRVGANADANGHGGGAAPDTDVQLLERLRRGEDTAFAELVECYGGRLLAVAKRVLRNDEDAHDAVQDAFLSAFKGLAAFNGSSKLSTWLHRIAVNAALMRLRTRKHRAEQSIDDLLPRFDEDGAWAEQSRPPTASGHELLVERETRAMVRRCIDQLPTSYRTVLMLRDIEDFDTDEVADMLGITANAVKIRVHRARQALRSLITRDMNDSDTVGRPVGTIAENPPTP